MMRQIGLFMIIWCCAMHVYAQKCERIASVCVDTEPYKTVSGLRIDISQVGGCWAFEDTYQCATDKQVSDCQPLRDKGCAQLGSSCLNYLADGTCSTYEQRFQCTNTTPQKEVESCVSNTFCIHENGQQRCFDASSSPDKDFGTAIATMEAMREMGTYMGKDNLQIFKGEDNRCSKKLGIGNCCKPSNGGGNMTNTVMAVKAGLTVAGEGIDVGSGYVYDALSNNGSSLAQGFKSMVNGLGGDFTFNPSASYMGVGLSFGAAPAGSMSMSLAGGQMHLYFNPTAFYIAVAMMVVQEVMKCDKDEQALSMKIGQRLCKQVGSYCSSKTPLGCMVVKETHCCFNSRLARIINEQGRAQLGMGWGSAENPQCGSLSISDFEKLDFSKIDLTEFIQEVTPKMPNVSQVAEKGKKSAQDMLDKRQHKQNVGNYYAP